MSKINDIIIVNAHTIQLNQDAKKGDIIDLNTIEHIDSSLLSRKIEEELNTRYKQMLNDEKKRWLIQQENILQKAVMDKELTIAQLKEQVKLNETNIRTEIESAYQLTIEKLNNQIQSLELEKQAFLKSKKVEIDLEVSKTENRLNQEMNRYQSMIEQLKLEKQAILDQAQLKLEQAVHTKAEELNKQINEKEKQISKLTLEKSTLNIKQMGEELETWVDQEYQNHALNGFETCEWIKDNLSVKGEGESRGTKADYLFKVYAEHPFVDENLLTSVACEIKSEDPNSTYKKKNSDHYDKLDKDRRKKECEYALLISELEWDSPNDAPIRKVQGYEKMYMVRPQYFIVFLNIVTAIALQYKSLVKGYNVERAKFKDAENIKDDFNHMKEEILDRSLKYIKNKTEEIDKSAEKIQEEAGRIREATRIILESHVQTIIHKIEQFKIHQIIDQINQLE
jgi:hypothetical protein